MNLNIQPTPAVALGAYEVTPIEIAGAYTVFANQGRLCQAQLDQADPRRPGQGPPLLHAGTPPGAGSPGRLPHGGPAAGSDAQRHGRRRARPGFRAARGEARPAHRTTAGSPGSHRGSSASSGWASTTTSELDLEGARSALPIWTEFMKRAHKHRQYRNVSEFEPPDGIVDCREWIPPRARWPPPAARARNCRHSSPALSLWKSAGCTAASWPGTPK